MELYLKDGGASVEFGAGPWLITFASLGIWDDKLYKINGFSMRNYWH